MADVRGYFWRTVDAGRNVEVRADSCPPVDGDGWQFQVCPTGLLTIHLFEGADWTPAEPVPDLDPPGPTSIASTVYNPATGEWEPSEILSAAGTVEALNVPVLSLDEFEETGPTT